MTEPARHIGGCPSNVHHDDTVCTCGAVSHFTRSQHALARLFALLDVAHMPVVAANTFERNCEKAERLDAIVAAKKSYDAALAAERERPTRSEPEGCSGEIGEGG